MAKTPLVSESALPPPALVVEDIYKSFGAVEVLKGVSLSARDHDVIAILVQHTKTLNRDRREPSSLYKYLPVGAHHGTGFYVAKTQKRRRSGSRSDLLLNQSLGSYFRIMSCLSRIQTRAWQTTRIKF